MFYYVLQVNRFDIVFFVLRLNLIYSRNSFMYVAFFTMCELIGEREADKVGETI